MLTDFQNSFTVGNSKQLILLASVERRTLHVSDWFLVMCCSLPPKYAVGFTGRNGETAISENGDAVHQLGPTQHGVCGMIKPSERRPFAATVIGNERVTAPEHWQDVRLLTLDIAGSHIM